MNYKLFSLVSGTLILSSLSASGQKNNTKPNILFILCDDMGYGDLGCYGQPFIRTPHLDAMASEGMRFTQAYAGSPVSAPSRASFMTTIAFHSSMDTGAIITHRVIKNDIVTGQIHTKGDANEKEDLYPVGYDYYMGKVVYSVPVLGRVLAFFVTFHGKIAAGSLIGLAILLQIIGGVMESAAEKKRE